MVDQEKLDKKHAEVPPDYYEVGLAKNFWQKIWHRRRLKTLLSLVPRRKVRYLDIGCHGGFLMNQVANQLGEVEGHGVDISPASIAYCKKKYPRFNYQVADALSLPFPNDSFDFITCFEVIEHLVEPKKALYEMRRVLKKDGEIMVLMPTESLIFRVIWFVWTRLGRGKVWHETHLNKIKSRDLAPLLQTMGFAIIKRQKSHGGMLLALKARLMNK
ncbi:MAG: class I SAM-dependent methyltransferase [Patescibacteria group bacterium]